MEAVRHTFRVYGEPVPQGSMRAFVVKGRPVLTSTSKGLKEWRKLIAHQANSYISEFVRDGGDSSLVGFIPSGEGVSIEISFSFVRPKSHFKKSGGLTKSAPLCKCTRPDIDKLTRAVLDALTGVFFEDDSQVVSLVVRKDYTEPGSPPGAEITVERFDSTDERLPESRTL